MRRLLRGVIDVNGTQQDALKVNYLRLYESNIRWKRESDSRIWLYISGYFGRVIEVPSIQTLRDYFEAENDVESSERLKDIEAAPLYIRSNYGNLLLERIEEVNQQAMALLFKEGQEIVQRGMNVGKGKLLRKIKGIREAYLHVTNGAQALIPTLGDPRNCASLQEGTNEAWLEYQDVELNKDKAYGALTGIDVVDNVCKGCKRGELWIHAAPPGGLKTTFALNWAYFLAYKLGQNSLYCSFEMPLRQLRKQLHALHSTHPRWALPENGGYKKPLDYDKIKTGELTPEDKVFYQAVLKDLETNPMYGRLQIWAPPVSVTVEDVKLKAEVYHQEWSVSLIVLDYGELLETTSKDTNYTIRYNSIIRASKRLALHFNGGEGVAVCLLAQINRDGMKDEVKMVDAQGKFAMNHLSYGNELEKAADYITTTYYYGKCRDEKWAWLNNMKNRDNSAFPATRIGVDMSCRHIRNMDPSEIQAASIGIDGVDDLASQMLAV